MVAYKMVVLTNAMPGQDEAFNRWYDEQHLDDLLALPGMKSAQRYKVVTGEGWRYFALYDVETDDLDGLMTEMYRRGKDGEIFMSPAFDTGYLLFTGEPIGSPREATG